jgi:4-diphosphocytidyl-2-C-methyl-D-erythritol kinase
MNFQQPTSLRKHEKCCVKSSTKGIELFSPAKLNLYLNVTGKYADGYHRLRSVVNRIDLADKISLKVSKDRGISFSCNKKSLQTEVNLCLRAARLLDKKYSLPQGVEIKLDKKIPVGSGLGGGSSNAAFTLLGLNKLFKLKIPLAELLQMGQSLGSDVNFFLYQVSWALIEGRGEKVTPIKTKRKQRYLVVYPNLEVSTKLVYRNLRPKLTKFLDNANIFNYCLQENVDFSEGELAFNCLQESAFKTYHQLKRVDEFFNKKEIPVYLSGSGSSFFIFRDNIAEAKINPLIRQINNQGWSVFTVQTF